MTAAVRVVSRSVTEHHGLQGLVVVGVSGRYTDEKKQVGRVWQNVHHGTRFAAIHGARTCEFALVTFFVAPQRGYRSLVRYDLSPLSIMVEKVVSPDREPLADR